MCGLRKMTSKEFLTEGVRLGPLAPLSHVFTMASFGKAQPRQLRLGSLCSRILPWPPSDMASGLETPPFAPSKPNRSNLPDSLSQTVR